VVLVGAWSLHLKHFGAHRGAEQSPTDLIPLWWPQEIEQATQTEERWHTIKLTRERWLGRYNRGWMRCRETTKRRCTFYERRTPPFGEKTKPSPQPPLCPIRSDWVGCSSIGNSNGWRADSLSRDQNNRSLHGWRGCKHQGGMLPTRWPRVSGPTRGVIFPGNRSMPRGIFPSLNSYWKPPCPRDGRCRPSTSTTAWQTPTITCWCSPTRWCSMRWATWSGVACSQPS